MIGLFIYEDPFCGKVFLDERLNPDNKPLPRVFEGEYCDTFVEHVDEMVRKAMENDLVSKTDALLAAALFLERKWPIPESLSSYIATSLRDAVVAFGHTEGRVEKRNTAICSAFGLTIPKGKGDTKIQILRSGLIHSYIWWRMALYSESLYKAAKQAETAFTGTKRLSQDACEKIFNSEEPERDPTFPPSLSGFVLLKLDPAGFTDGKIIFQDDDFLREIAPMVTRIRTQETDIFLEAIGLKQEKCR